MPKRLRTPAKRPTDVNQLAHFLVGQSTAEPALMPTKSEISRIMAEMGRRGGKKSAKARMKKIAPEVRSEIALKAAKARWAKKAASKQN
jgi:hypothetical protein